MSSLSAGTARRDGTAWDASSRTSLTCVKSGRARGTGDRDGGVCSPGAVALHGRPGGTETRGTTVAEAAHVLIVDDDPRVRSMLARYLKGEGFRISEAGDGAAMRDCLAREPPDLVLLDL